MALPKVVKKIASTPRKLSKRERTIKQYYEQFNRSVKRFLEDTKPEDDATIYLENLKSQLIQNALGIEVHFGRLEFKPNPYGRNVPVFDEAFKEKIKKDAIDWLNAVELEISFTDKEIKQLAASYKYIYMYKLKSEIESIAEENAAKDAQEMFEKYIKEKMEA